MAGRRNSGFTLIELLVVIAIIALLVGILTPSFTGAIAIARRGTCAKNMREIVSACILYADEARLHRGRGNTPNALPSSAPTTANWHLSNVGNRHSLWPLIEYQFAPGDLFLCRGVTGYRAAQRSDGAFSDTTFSYSYISMVGRTSGNPLGVLTTSNTPSSLVILADMNPRCRPGVREVAQPKEQNSRSHDSSGQVGKGQNIARFDGNVEWITEAKVVTGSRRNDWIYHTTRSPEEDGQSGPEDDVFLIP